MAMSKRDYVAIAKAIKDSIVEPAQRSLTHYTACADVADRIADVCAADNPRFDRKRFLDACGLDKT